MGIASIASRRQRSVSTEISKGVAINPVGRRCRGTFPSEEKGLRDVRGPLKRDTIKVRPVRHFSHRLCWYGGNTHRILLNFTACCMTDSPPADHKGKQQWAPRNKQGHNMNASLKRPVTEKADLRSRTGIRHVLVADESTVTARGTGSESISSSQETTRCFSWFLWIWL